MTVTHKISIDFATKDNAAIVDVSQGDSQTRIVEAHLFVGGVPFVVPDGFSASLAFKKPDKTGGWYDELPDGSVAATIDGNVVLISLVDEVLQVAGKVTASIVLKNNVFEQLAAFPFIINVVANPAADQQVSNSYYKVSSVESLNIALDEKMDKGVADRPIFMGGHSIYDAGGFSMEYLIDGDPVGYVGFSPHFDTKDAESGNTYGVLEFSGGVDVDSLAILRNVAPGVQPFDAVNVDQLNSALRPTTDEKYFDIDYDGVVSLKLEYQNGGNKNAELPEVIVIPDVIGTTAVSALAEYMFQKNNRVKSVTIPKSILKIPKGFANEAFNLAEVKGTENVEVLGNGAFRKSGIKKALFPNLKTFEGSQNFGYAAYLTIVDIGDSVTEVPTGCFFGCESLSLALGGSSVTSVGKETFFATRNLKNLPLLSSVKNISDGAFQLSRVNYDWWNASFSSVGANGTPAKFNPTDWWSGCEYTPCENPLGSTFHQKNPAWAETYIPSGDGNSSDKWGDGCVEISAVHIYSALKNAPFTTPEEFIDLLRGKEDDQGLILQVLPKPSGASQSDYGYDDMKRWLEALGLKCEVLKYNTGNLQKVYTALADGALVLTSVHPNHAGVIYGVANNGEVLVLDSGSYKRMVGVYEAGTFQQPIWSLVLHGGDLMIVKKGE